MTAATVAAGHPCLLQLTVVDVSRGVAVVLHDTSAVDEHVDDVGLLGDILVELLATSLGGDVAGNAGISACPNG